MIYNKDAFCVAIYTSQTLHLLCILYLRSSVAVESLGARTLVAAAIGQLGGIVGGGGARGYSFERFRKKQEN